MSNLSPNEFARQLQVARELAKPLATPEPGFHPAKQMDEAGLSQAVRDLADAVLCLANLCSDLEDGLRAIGSHPSLL